MKNSSFTFRSSWFEAIKDQPDSVRLSLMDAICRYAIDGEIPDDLGDVAKVAFSLIRTEIDSATRKKRNRQTTAAVPTAELPAAEVQQPAVSAPDQPSPDPEPCYTNFDSAVARLLTDRYCCERLYKGRLANIQAAIDDFKRYAVRKGLISKFNDSNMTHEDLCDMMVNAMRHNAYSQKAFQDPD